MSTELRRARHRQVFIFLLVWVAMLGLLGRLFYWQVLQSTTGYRLLHRASDEHMQSQIVAAPRGRIFDVQGRLLATNVVRDDVYVEPIQFATDHADNYQNDLIAQIDALHQVLPAISKDILRQSFGSGRVTVRVAGPIDPGQSSQLRRLHLSDTFLEPRSWRVYPDNDLAAQVLGYVQDTQGVYGVEHQYNTLLAGKPGSFTAESDLNGDPLTVGAHSVANPVSGADLMLTIDAAVQYDVQIALATTVQQMAARSGTVVVLDARSGAVVALAGYPTFDPNRYADFAARKGCLGAQEVYINPALYCSYEPGSIMKVVTMAAALDQKLLTPVTTLFDPGYRDFTDGTPRVTNWMDKSYGTETMTEVLAHSANVGAAYVAHDLLGARRFYPYLQRFGFGKDTGLLNPETAGTFRTPQSVGWSESDLVRQSFGQGISVTPFQMAMAYQAIADGGIMMQPYLLAGVKNNGTTIVTRPTVQRRVISAETARTLTSMLVSATDFNAQVTIPHYSVAAKTGTATTQGMAMDQTEASLAGFLPASDPRFVILVKLDRPQNKIYGGTAAAPLWRLIAQQLIFHEHILSDQP